MAIVKRGARYYVVVRVDGKQKWIPAGVRRRDAIALEAEMKADLAKGTYRQIKRATFAEFVDIWRQDAKRHLQPSTQDEYECYLNRHLLPYFGSRQMRDIDAHAIQRYINVKLDSGLSNKSVRNHLAALGSLMTRAVAWDFLAASPMPHVIRPKRQQSKASYLSADKVRLLLAEAEEPWRTLLLTTVMTGARQSEVLGLTWNHVDFERETIRIEQKLYRGKIVEQTKSESSERVVPMSPQLTDALLLHKVSAPASALNLVFTRSDGRPLTKKACSTALKATLERSGLTGIGYHSLRHTFTSLLVAQGENVKVVQELLGHSNSAMTMHYAHTLEGAKSLAVQRLEKAIFDDGRGA